MTYEKRTGYEIFTATPADLMRLIRRPPPYCLNAELWRRRVNQLRSTAHRQEFVGASYEQVMSATDWPEGRDLMQRYAADLAEVPPATSVRRVRRWSTEGDEFSRDRFDAGYEDYWSTRKRARRPTNGRVIRLTTCIGGDGGKKPAQLAWTGAAACLLVDRLEDAGYRVDVAAIHTGRGLREHYPPDRQTVFMVEVKQAEEALDIDRFLMVTAAPWFFRWHVFRLHHEVNTVINDSLGRTDNAATPDDVKGDIHLPSAYSLEEARTVLARVLRQFQSSEAV